MISMSDTILNALKLDKALSSIIGGRVYWLRPPNKLKQSYISFFEITNSENDAADDKEYSSQIEFQVDIWTYDSYVPIANEVCRIMKNLGFQRHALSDQYEEDTKIIHKPYQFSITKEV